jgi:hypothetical protein
MRRVWSGQMSRGQYHSPLRFRRSQERGTSSSRTTVLSTRPPCHLTMWSRAHQLRACEQAHTTGSLPRLGSDSRPRRERGFSDEERDQRSRQALRLNLKRYLRLGYHGPRWMKAQLRLLGKEPDDVVAAKVGRSVNAVRIMRNRLGIPTALDRMRRR